GHRGMLSRYVSVDVAVPEGMPQRCADLRRAGQGGSLGHREPDARSSRRNRGHRAGCRQLRGTFAIYADRERIPGAVENASADVDVCSARLTSGTGTAGTDTDTEKGQLARPMAAAQAAPAPCTPNRRGRAA